MKKKILIKKQDTIVFKGKMMNIPFKQSAIVQKSIDLFDDDDPCIIHTSYVIKHFVDDLLKLFDLSQTDTLYAKEYAEKLYFLDFENIDDLTIILKK